MIIATDADVDGAHIRLLMITFLCNFSLTLSRKGMFIFLQTPLFRVRNKKETHYCYTDEERLAAIKKCGANPEVTRFKGLGEISPDEFRQFIGPDMRLDRVSLRKEDGERFARILYGQVHHGKTKLYYTKSGYRR